MQAGLEEFGSDVVVVGAEQIPKRSFALDQLLKGEIKMAKRCSHFFTTNQTWSWVKKGNEVIVKKDRDGNFYAVKRYWGKCTQCGKMASWTERVYQIPS